MSCQNSPFKKRNNRQLLIKFMLQIIQKIVEIKKSFPNILPRSELCHIISILSTNKFTVLKGQNSSIFRSTLMESIKGLTNLSRMSAREEKKMFQMRSLNFAFYFRLILSFQKRIQFITHWISFTILGCNYGTEKVREGGWKKGMNCTFAHCQTETGARWEKSLLCQSENNSRRFIKF